MGARAVGEVERNGNVTEEEQDSKLHPTREGERLLKDWYAARDRHERAKRDLNSAACDLANAETAFAKWMLPTDAKVGESFLMWHGTKLVQVEKTDQYDARVTIRGKR